MTSNVRTYQPYRLFLNSSGTKNVTPIVTDGKPSNVEFDFRLQSPIMLQPQDPHSIAVAVESASIPLSYYCIDELNNKMALSIIRTQQGQPETQLISLVIPPGNYSIKQLVFKLNNLISNVSDVDFVYDSVSSKIGLQSIDETIRYICNDSPDSTLSVQLGYTPNQNQLPQPTPFTDLENVVNYQSFFEDVVSLIYTTGVCVCMDNLSSKNSTFTEDSRNGDTLLRIPLTGGSNTIQNYSTSNPIYTILPSNHLFRIILSLRDDKGQLLRLNGNHTWVVVLLISFIITTPINIPDNLFSTQRDSLNTSRRLFEHAANQEKLKK